MMRGWGDKGMGRVGEDEFGWMDGRKKMEDVRLEMEDSRWRVADEI